MNTTFKTLLKYSFVLIALSLATSAFSIGHPKVKKEKEDGNGDDECHLNININTPQDVIYFITIESLTYLDFCDLHVGYQFDGDPMTYVQLGGWVQTIDGWRAQVSIPFPYSFVSAKCEGENTQFTFGLYCNDSNGQYNSTAFEPSPRFDHFKLCCTEYGDDTRLQEVLGSGGTPGKVEASNDYAVDLESEKVQSDVNTETQSSSVNVDYYIYDRFGNQMLILKGISKEQDIQKLLYSTNLRTGLYFINYLEGKAIKTKKVFKQ